MRTSFGPLLGLALVLSAAPAMAEEEAASSITINGSATVVSDYRFRGISQTDKDFAVQGGITVSHDSGLYASVWGSSVDEYVAAGSDQEIDLIAGYKKTFGGTTVDVGAIYYFYPGSHKIVPGYASDFIEPYIALSHTLGPVTAKVSAAYAPKQKALASAHPKDDNLYTALDLSGGIPNTPVSLSAHVGHSFGPSFLTIGKEYTDWSLGATYTHKAITFGVSYVDTNKALLSPITFKNISKAGVVATVGVSF